MDKPKPIVEVSVSVESKEVRLISMFASQDAVCDFREFGNLLHTQGNEYCLFIDTRYDFDEVLEYIKNYG